LQKIDWLWIEFVDHLNDIFNLNDYTGRQTLESEIKVYFSEDFQCAEHESGHRIAHVRFLKYPNVKVQKSRFWPIFEVM